MEHHVCTGGCGGVSDSASVCQAEGCPKQGEPMASCSCESGSHEEVKATPAPVQEFDVDANL